MVCLPSLWTGNATAFATTSWGDVVGRSETLTAGGTLVTRATAWLGGAPLDLGTLIPDPAQPGSFLGNSRALDISNS